MRIGIIGAATVGATLAARFAAAGHELRVANRRGREAAIASLAKAGAPPAAADLGDALDSEVVVLALPWTGVRDLLAAGIDWQGRVLVDATNIFLSYAPDFRVDDLHGDSGSELIARLAPSARVVKAFNTLPFAKLYAPVPAGYRRVQMTTPWTWPPPWCPMRGCTRSCSARSRPPAARWSSAACSAASICWRRCPRRTRLEQRGHPS